MIHVFPLDHHLKTKLYLGFRHRKPRHPPFEEFYWWLIPLPLFRHFHLSTGTCLHPGLENRNSHECLESVYPPSEKRNPLSRKYHERSFCQSTPCPHIHQIDGLGHLKGKWKKYFSNVCKLLDARKYYNNKSKQWKSNPGLFTAGLIILL